MGSVTPLLAAAEVLQKEHDLFFVGTKKGPEKKVVIEMEIPFFSIVSAKIRRYLSFYHFLVPFQLFVALVQSAILCVRIRPDVIVSAGGFVAVPLVWVGFFFRIKTVIHQQDIHPGLANRCMLPVATITTVAFEESLTDFPNALWIGNPVRRLDPVTDIFASYTDAPIVLIVGGGTGSRAMNELITEKFCSIAHIIHVTGQKREGNMEKIVHKRYHQYSFLGDELKEALHRAAIVISRAGLGAITELSTLAKPAIIIPMPHSHQEKNARLLEKKDAAIVCHEETLTSEKLFTVLETLLSDETKQKELSKNIHSLFPKESVARFVDVILRVHVL